MGCSSKSAPVYYYPMFTVTPYAQLPPVHKYPLFTSNTKSKSKLFPINFRIPSGFHLVGNSPSAPVKVTGKWNSLGIFSGFQDIDPKGCILRVGRRCNDVLPSSGDSSSIRVHESGLWKRLKFSNHTPVYHTLEHLWCTCGEHPSSGTWWDNTSNSASSRLSVLSGIGTNIWQTHIRNRPTSIHLSFIAFWGTSPWSVCP